MRIPLALSVLLPPVGIVRVKLRAVRPAATVCDDPCAAASGSLDTICVIVQVRTNGYGAAVARSCRRLQVRKHNALPSAQPTTGPTRLRTGREDMEGRGKRDRTLGAVRHVGGVRAVRAMRARTDRSGVGEAAREARAEGHVGCVWVTCAAAEVTADAPEEATERGSGRGCGPSRGLSLCHVAWLSSRAFHVARSHRYAT